MAELVTDYLEGDLPWRRRVAAWLHLRACQACTAYFEQMRRTIALLRRAPPPVLSDSEADSVLQRTIEPRTP